MRANAFTIFIFYWYKCVSFPVFGARFSFDPTQKLGLDIASCILTRFARFSIQCGFAVVWYISSLFQYNVDLKHLCITAGLHWDKMLKENQNLLYARKFSCSNNYGSWSCNLLSIFGLKHSQLCNISSLNCRLHIFTKLIFLFAMIALVWLISTAFRRLVVVPLKPYIVGCKCIWKVFICCVLFSTYFVDLRNSFSYTLIKWIEIRGHHLLYFPP